MMSWPIIVIVEVSVVAAALYVIIVEKIKAHLITLVFALASLVAFVIKLILNW
jgi:hypothetical protein